MAEDKFNQQSAPSFDRKDSCGISVDGTMNNSPEKLKSPVQFSEQRKLEVIATAVSHKDRGVSDIAVEFNIPRSTLYRWIKEEREKNFSKLKENKPKLDISADRAGRLNTKNSRKLEIIAAAQESGSNVADVAKKFGVPRSTLYRWIKDLGKIQQSSPSKTYTDGGQRGKKRKSSNSQSSHDLIYTQEYGMPPIMSQYSGGRNVSFMPESMGRFTNNRNDILAEAMMNESAIPEIAKKYNLQPEALQKWVNDNRFNPRRFLNGKENKPEYHPLDADLAALVHQTGENNMNQLNAHFLANEFHSQGHVPMLDRDYSKGTNGNMSIFRHPIQNPQAIMQQHNLMRANQVAAQMGERDTNQFLRPPQMEMGVMENFPNLYKL